jgi:hypothetical protein
MRETDEMQGRPKKKKGQFGNAKHRICTANYLRAVLTMRVDKLIVADASRSRAANPCKRVNICAVFDGKNHRSVLCLASNTFELFCRLCFDSDATIMRECSENSGLQMHRSWLWENV